MQQVIRSNIVVLLIKNELRFGTETEFITAEKYRKPMLVYFLGDKENDKVEKLRRYIQKKRFMYILWQIYCWARARPCNL